MKSSPLTIKDMALKAGVSVATISRAMSNHTRVKVAPETLKKVDALIKKHGYTLHLAAKHLRQSSTKTVGVVFPYVPGIFYSEYYTHILSGITEYLMGTEYRFKMLLLKEGQTWDGYNFRSGEGVDGLILVHWFKIFSHKEALEKVDIPCVVINDYDPKIKSSIVYADQYLGGYKAAEYLHGLGHTKIGILTGPAWSVDNQQRIRGFKAFFKQKNISFDPSFQEDGKFLEQEAFQKTDCLIRKKVSAIFCCNDQMAFGVLRKLKVMGLNSPQDISIVGFDDEMRSSLTHPPLTTINVDVAGIAKEAVQILLGHLKEKRAHAIVRKTPVYLVERNSVKKA